MKKRKYAFYLPFFFVIVLLGQTGCESNVLDKIERHQVMPWGLQKMNVESMWSQGIKGKGVRISVMDSGTDYNHPEFSGRLKAGYNAIQPDEPPLDDNGHGTLVTGIISANDNSFGIVGVAPEAEIYPVKVLDAYGEGEIANIAKGIDWCIKNDIQVINMSFSIPNDDEELKKSITKAIKHGIIIVASSYNSSGLEAGFPASYDGVISVTSVDSSYKPLDSNALGKIDFSAPGKVIYTTTLAGGYTEIEGNSFATPYITGICALLLESGVKSKDIYSTLKLMSVDIGDIGRDRTFGEGFVKLN